MTLGRLMELYQAEQQGKQIMMRVYYSGNRFYKPSEQDIKEVKITECELKDLVFDNQEETTAYIYTFFIKDEEDKYGCKIK